MKITKLWLFVLLTLLVSSFAFASTPPNPSETFLYYSFDDDDLSGSNPLDLTGNTTATTTDATTGTTGKINQAFLYDGDGDYVETSAFTAPEQNTYCIWFNSDSITGARNTIMSKRPASDDRDWQATLEDSTNNIHVNYYNGADSPAGTMQSTTTILDDTYYHVCLTRDGNNVELFVNGVSEDTDSTANKGRENKVLQVGIFNGAGGTDNGFNGILDELVLLNKVATQDEIEYLYNSGSPTESQQYPFTSGNFTITAKDSADSSTINTFNATINGTLYNTTIGSITTPYLLNETDILNITVEAENYFAYENETYNTSNGNLQAELDPQTLIDFTLLTPNNSITNQTTFNITWTEAVSPTNRTVTYNGTVEYTDNATIVDTFSTTDLFYNLNITNYLSENYTITINATENGTGSSKVQSSTLRVDFPNYFYFYDANDGTTPLDGENVTIDFPNLATDTTLTTDTEGKIVFNSYQDDILQKGIYNITFTSKQGFITPITFERTFNTLPVNESFNISRANLTIEVRDADTGSLVNENVTVAITDIGSFTTTTGTLNFENQSLVSQEYTVYVSSANYTFNQKSFTYTNQEALTVEVFSYDKADTNIATIFVNTYDSFLNVLAGVDLRLQVLDPASGSFTEIGQRTTSSSGFAAFNVLLEEQTYRVLAIYTDNQGNVYQEFSSEAGEIFYVNNQEVNIYMDTLSTTTTLPYSGLSVNVTNTTLLNNVSFHGVDFVDTTGASHTICLGWYSIQNYQEELQAEECQTGASGTVTFTGGYNLNRSFTWIVKAYVKEGDTITRYFYEQRYTSKDSFEEQFSPIIKWLIALSLIGGLAISININRPDFFSYISIFLSLIWTILTPSWYSGTLLGLNILFAAGILYHAKQRSNADGI